MFGERNENVMGVEILGITIGQEERESLQCTFSLHTRARAPLNKHIWDYWSFSTLRFPLQRMFPVLTLTYGFRLSIKSMTCPEPLLGYQALCGMLWKQSQRRPVVLGLEREAGKHTPVIFIQWGKHCDQLPCRTLWDLWDGPLTHLRETGKMSRRRKLGQTRSSYQLLQNNPQADEET